MVLAPLVMAFVLQTIPVATTSSDTTPPERVTSDSIVTADSSALLPWYRRVQVLDARLVPTAAFETVSDTQPRRRHAVQLSDEYYTRLQIHRNASYLELPVFGAEYWLGQKLINDSPRASWVKPTHVGVAATLGALFAVNTITGVWNLYESWGSTNDRALVLAHSALMLGSDAGFAYTGMIAGDANRTLNGQNRHKNAALVSMGIAAAGTALMWITRGL
jgi:hypothetical protein